MTDLRHPSENLIRYVLLAVAAFLVLGWMLWSVAEEEKCESHGGVAVYDYSYDVTCVAPHEGAE